MREEMDGGRQRIKWEESVIGAFTSLVIAFELSNSTFSPEETIRHPFLETTVSHTVMWLLCGDN